MSLGEFQADEAQPRDHEAELVEKHEVSDTIKVSSTAHTAFFYVDLTTKFLVDHDTVHLSGLGKTVTVVVTIAEILKKEGIAEVVSVQTGLVPIPPDQRKPGSTKSNKAKIDITVKKAPGYFDYVKKKKAVNEENKVIRDKLEEARQKMQEKLKREAEATA